MSHRSFGEHCREIARRFLMTAVVVDDELSVGEEPRVHGHLKRPVRGTSGPSAAPEEPTPHRTLKIGPVTRASPDASSEDHAAHSKAVARADIVILDWRLDPASGADALPLLKRILTDDHPHRLRLVAFFTGEPDHEAIRERIVGGLDGLVGSRRVVSGVAERCGGIDFGACRIVVYGKPGSAAVDAGTVVREEDLAGRLIADFAEMVEGLLPSIVLAALSAVRENVHRLLQCFPRDLDPAFLVHRACLPQPWESQRHMLEHIASELLGIMDDATMKSTVGSSPAGLKAIKLWLNECLPGNIVLGSRQGADGKVMSRDQTLDVLELGITAARGPLKKGAKEYDLLSHAFSGGADDSRERDRRFASAMSFRQVLPDTPRLLTMGTVVRPVKQDYGDHEVLVCVTPSCDSVRLTRESSFLFLPLVEPMQDTLQVVVPNGGTGHRRMTISLKPSHWRMMKFKPHADRQCVLSHRRGQNGAATFADAGGTQYVWVGELKPEFAQSIAQAIGDRMSRIPLNQSEWIRRSQRVGTR